MSTGESRASGLKNPPSNESIPSRRKSKGANTRIENQEKQGFAKKFEDVPKNKEIEKDFNSIIDFIKVEWGGIGLLIA